MIITKTDDGRWVYDYEMFYHHAELPNDLYTRCYQIMIGDKLEASNPYSRKQCEILEEQLNNAGFITRVAKHGETKKWSVAIIGKEDNNDNEGLCTL